jgi:U4/U6.U5 tri-snRNP-associated protein 1
MERNISPTLLCNPRIQGTSRTLHFVVASNIKVQQRMKLDMTLDIASSGTAADWVKTSRVKEQDAIAQAKRLAELKRKQLEEEEDELVMQSSSLYSSSDLKGLKVMHGANDFDEGEEVILTLADSNVLDKDEDGKALGINEGGDVLENVLLADKDRRIDREAKKRRLNQPVYSALDDYEFQDGMATGSRAPMLPQYEKEKKAQPKFELGNDGVASFAPSSIASISTTKTSGGGGVSNIHSLQSSTKAASDYYSAVEYTAFSKSKKGKDKKNKAFRKKSTEDEEQPEEVESGANESKSMDVEDGNAPKVVVPKVVPKLKFSSIDLDEDDPDLAQSLARARRMALQQRVKSEEMVQDSSEAGAGGIANVEDRGAMVAMSLASKAKGAVSSALTHEDEGEDTLNVEGRLANGSLVFNSTTEFATRLQAHLSEKARSKSEALMRDLERTVDRTATATAGAATAGAAAGAAAGGVRRTADHDAMDEDEDEDGAGGDDQKVNISGTMEDFAGLSDMDDSDDSDGDAQGGARAGEGEGEAGDEDLAFVHRQPLVGKGMGATLALLKETGELKKSEQLAGRAKDNRAYDPSSADHGVKLEYRDEFGRKLTQKEAFRQLSYKFHGYGPGQKKLEKRLKVWGAVFCFMFCVLLNCYASMVVCCGFDKNSFPLPFDAQIIQTLERENKAQSSRAGILEGVGGTMKSLTTAQEATGRAHITIQVPLHYTHTSCWTIYGLI